MKNLIITLIWIIIYTQIINALPNWTNWVTGSSGSNTVKLRAKEYIVTGQYAPFEIQGHNDYAGIGATTTISLYEKHIIGEEVIWTKTVSESDIYESFKATTKAKSEPFSSHATYYAKFAIKVGSYTYATFQTSDLVVEMYDKDEYDPNDNFSQASNLGSNGGFIGPLIINNDEDYFKILVTASYPSIDLKISFLNDEGNLDLFLYNSSQQQIDASNSLYNDQEEINKTLSSGTYYFKVKGAGSNTKNFYDLNIIYSLPAPQPPTANAASSITQTSFTANWSSSATATGYYLDVATNSSFTNYVNGYQNLNVNNVTNRSVTGLSANTTYYYRLRAYNGGGPSGNSNTISATTQNINPPPAPTANAASSITQTSFTANWSSSATATGYYLDVATNSSFTNYVDGYQNLNVNNVTNRSVTGLSANTTYYYRLRAYNGGGPSGNSNTISATTQNINPPPAPTANAASSITQTSFTANWSSSATATGYYLDVATNSSFTNYVNGYQNLNVNNVTNRSVTGLSANTTYYYRLRAYNGGGPSGNSNTISATTQNINPPPAPTANAASSITQTSFTANWSSSATATGYYLDVATNSSFTNYVNGYQNLNVNNVTNRSVTGLSANTTYYYRLRAYNGGGPSGNSNTISATTQNINPPPAPTANAASSITQTSFTANWSSSATATGYYLDVATNSSFTNYVDGYQNLNVNNVTNRSVTGLSANTTYYYRLRAYNGGGPSGNSNTISATTQNINPPPAPTANAASSITQTSFTANWSSSATATGYYLDVATNSSFTNYVNGYQNLNVNNVTNRSVTGLSANTTYYYRLRAYNGGGPSGNSNTISATTQNINPPPAPTANAASSITQTSFTANWSSSATATGYYLDVATNSSFTNYVNGYQNLNVNNVTNRSVTGLSANTTYYYRLRAYNDGGPSGNSNTISATTQNINPPPAPTANAASSITQTSFTANWSSSATATGYYLDVATNSSFTNYVNGYQNLNVNNVTNRSVTGLSANTTYYYRLRAYNDGGPSGNSNTISATTQNINPPPAPTANAASSITQTSFTANWSSSATATGYYLDVATNSSFTNYVNGYQNLNVNNVTNRSVTGLSANTTYYYRLRAYNGGGPSGNSNTISATTQNINPPPAPTANAASSITQTSFTANWSSSATATGYYLDVATNSSFTNYVNGYQNLNVNNVTNRSVTGLSANTTYYYRLRAYNDGGPSGNSNTISATTQNISISSISGYIRKSDNSPLSEVVVKVNNQPQGTTDANGYYSVQVSSSGVIIIQPSYPRFSFNPNSLTYNNVTNNLVNQNYTAIQTTYLISGYVKKSDATPLSGVTITFNNGGGTTLTSSTGYYEKSITNTETYTWAGSSTPSYLNGWTFSPINRTYSELTEDLTEQNFEGIPPTPTLSVNPATLSFGTIQINTWSPPQSYSLSGNNLLSDVVITPNYGFEISLNKDTGWTDNQISLKPNGGSITSQEIYVRFHPPIVNNYSSDIINATLGAEYKTINVSGTGISTPNPTIITSVGAISNFGYYTLNTPSPPKEYTVSGTNLTSDLVITPPSGFQISLDNNSWFGDHITLPQSGGTVTTTTIYVRFYPTAVQSYSGNITNSSSGATTKNISVSGTGVAVPTPTIITNALALPDFGNIIVNTPSTSYSYTIFGTNLKADLTITPPSRFQISLDNNSWFGDHITLPQSEGTVTTTTIYVRFYPTAVQSYSGNITNSSSGATTKNISVSGTGVAVPTPTIITNALALPDFGNIIVNTPSTSYSYTIFGTNLKADLTITPPSRFQISLDNNSWFGDHITLPQSEGTVTTTTIYVRFYPTAVQSYSGNITNSSSGATTMNISVSGTGIEDKPIADFFGDPTIGIAPLSVSFTDRSSGSISSWSWDFGDGAIVNIQNPSHNYNVANSYTVKLTVTGPGGSDTKTILNYITVNAPFLEITPAYKALTCDADSLTVEVKSNINWNASTDVYWLYVEPLSGFGDTNLTIHCDPNPNSSIRSAFIFIEGSNLSDTLKIEQQGILTGINDLEFSKEDVHNYYLMNNYPNPFNPQTSIEFGISEESTNSLMIFDVNGRLVNTILKNITLHKGQFRYKFNAEHLPSGVYILVLTSSSVVSNKTYKGVKKMILLK